MAKKRKKKPQPQQIFSPKRYIRERSRKLPIGPCFASHEDDQKGLFQIVVTRAKPSGKYLVGIYLIDVWCLGLKSTNYFPNMEPEEMEDFLDKLGRSENRPLAQVAYPWVHHLIYRGIEYAKNLGMRPDKDFALTRYILEPEADIEENFDFQFGRDGKPFLLAGPYDNGPKLIATLMRTVGKGNFDYLLPIGGSGRMEDW